MVTTRFSKFVLALNAGIPLAFVAWDAARHQLGADPVNEAIHITGWMALFFLTLSLAVTPLRRATHLNWLVSYRRTLGVYGFVYAAAHLSIYFWWDRGRSIVSTFSEIIGKPFITFGACAIVLLAPLALTSTNGMIQRLGPKRWGWLHTLAYPATLLAAIHYWLEGKLVTLDKKVFAGVVVGMLFYRWFAVFATARAATKLAPAPAASTPKRAKYWRGKLKVARIFRETPTVQTFRLTAADGGQLPFDYLPGQYLNLTLDIGGKKVPRSYTIASSPTQRDYCELTVKREPHGVASRHLHDMLAEGHELVIGAPAGKFTFVGTESKHVLLIGGGVGITPLMSIVRALTDRAWPFVIDLFYSVRDPRELIFADELEHLAKRFANLHLHLVVTGEAGEHWTGLRGRIDAALVRKYVPDVHETIAFVCGPNSMLEPMRAMLAELGLPAERVKFEEFVSPSGNVKADGVTNSESAVSSDVAPASDEAATVTFLRSGRTAAASAGKTLLELAEEVGVDIPFECRAGICGSCKTRLAAGKVTMESEEALSPADKQQGFILACQAHAVGDISVDA